MSEEWIDAIHDACQSISNEAYSLLNLAQAFHQTGNDVVASELFQIAEALLAASRAIPKAIGQHLHDQLRADQESLALTLQVALFGSRKEEPCVT